MVPGLLSHPKRLNTRRLAICFLTCGTPVSRLALISQALFGTVTATNTPPAIFPKQQYNDDQAAAQFQTIEVL
jgi:hypothetical protein